MPDEVFFCKGPEKHPWVKEDDARHCCNGFRRERRAIVSPEGVESLEFYWHPEGEPKPHSIYDDPAQHVPFLRRLAGMSAASRSDQLTASLPIVSGWLVLELVEDWIARGNMRRITGVRRTLAHLPCNTLTVALRTLTDYIGGVREPSRALCKLLADYGAALVEQSEWGLAIDVYRTAIRHSGRMRELGSQPTAYERLAYSLRQDGRVWEADRALVNGLDAAHVFGDRSGELRLELAQANAAEHAGNYLDATGQLDDIIEIARREGRRSLLARALHDRGVVAHDCDDELAAAGFLHAAIHTYESVRIRQRAEVDLACVIAALGRLTSAEDALLSLYHRAESRQTRLSAAINLADVSSRQGHHDKFARFRDELGDEPLPARLRAGFLIIVGDALRREQQPEAVEAYRDAVEFARHHGLNDHAWRAESALHRSAG